MKVLVVVPVYIANDLHRQFTEGTVKSLIASDIPDSWGLDILLVNNYCWRPKNDVFKGIVGSGVTLVDNPRGNNVSAAWNLGIETGFADSYDYVIVSNNDIVAHPLCVANLVKFAQSHPEFVLWTANEYSNLRTLNSAELGDSFDDHPHFSFFMVSELGVSRLKSKEENTDEPYPGYFDETFRVAYMEDNDYHQRLLRAGLKAGKTASALFYHYGSRTIKVDDNLNLENNVTYNQNRHHFQEKWGFDVHARVVGNDDPIRFDYYGPFQKRKK